jgi:GTP-binding protein
MVETLRVNVFLRNACLGKNGNADFGKSTAKVMIISETAKLFRIFFVPLHRKNRIFMEIKTAEFTLSAPTQSMCPQDTKPEYAFIGRSNVGKSSLINMLTNHRRLAKTSQTPGKTLLINHFMINKEWYLVDLPGYGYAKRSKKEVDRLDQMIRGYILQREQLVNVFVLVDVRLEPQKIDLEFIDWLGVSSIPFAIVFTKADKLTPNKARQAVEAYKQKLSETWEELPPIFLTSAEKKEGRDELLQYIDDINQSLKNG